MAIRTLVSPMNEKRKKTGPSTNSFYSQYQLTDEEIRLFDKLALLPKPSIKRALGKKKNRVQEES